MNLSTTTISATDLFSFSQQIAQLNLGYLGIAVAILGVMGGVFVYFNIKPLKDALDKQEFAVEDLKKQAQNLLQLSAEQSKASFNDFKKEQTIVLDDRFQKQEEHFNLEIQNQIQISEKSLAERVEIVSENKDLKLRELIQAEISSKLKELDKELLGKITMNHESITKAVTDVTRSISRLQSQLTSVGEQVKELQVYKYSKEGQMGAILVSIELLRDAVTDFLKNMSAIDDKSKEKTFAWKVKMRLEGLIQELGDNQLELKDKYQIEEELTKIENVSSLSDLISELRAKLN